MQALVIGDQVSLAFSTVLGELQLGTEEEDEGSEPTDRAYWDGKVGKSTMEVVDSIAGLVRSVDPNLVPKYNKYYVGFAQRNGSTLNFVVLKPKGQWVRAEVKLDKSDEVLEKLESAGIDLMEHSARTNRYKFRLSKGEHEKHAELLTTLFRDSLKAFTSSD